VSGGVARLRRGDRIVSDESSPFENLLDVFVYAPVGLALVATEELPKLVARGRAQLEGQLTMAKVVGQFAVAQGRQQLAARRQPIPAPDPSPGSPHTGDRMATDDNEDAAPARPADQEDDTEPPLPVAAPPPAAPSVPEPSGLAIPGYDSLAASQVVPRLAGLSADELAAVDAYESAHRARRTILNRVRQLQER
jgi:hypothetical protein